MGFLMEDLSADLLSHFPASEVTDLFLRPGLLAFVVNDGRAGSPPALLPTHMPFRLTLDMILEDFHLPC